MTQGYPKVKRAAMNVGAFDHYNPGNDCLKDVMLRAGGPWVKEAPNPWELPELYAASFRYDGYPHTMPAGKSIVWILPPAAADSWTVLFDGEGELLLWWDHSGGTADSGPITTSGTEVVVTQDQLTFYVELINTNGSDPVRNIRIVRTAELADYATKPWRTPYLDLHRGIAAIRCVDLMSPNWSHVASLQPHLWVRLQAVPQGERSWGDANTKYPWVGVDGDLIHPDEGTTVIGEVSGTVGVLRGYSRYWNDDANATNFAAIEVPSTPDGSAPLALFQPGEKLVLPSGGYARVETSAEQMPYWPDGPGKGGHLEYFVGDATWFTRQWLGTGVICALANQLDADLWVNIPEAASDAMLHEFFAALATTLDGRRSVIVEYGNEPWHNSFSFRSHLIGLMNVRAEPSIEFTYMRGLAHCVDIARTHLGSRVRGTIQVSVFDQEPVDIAGYLDVQWNGQTLRSRLDLISLNAYVGNGSHGFTTAQQIQDDVRITHLPYYETRLVLWVPAIQSMGLLPAVYEGAINPVANGDPAAQQANYDYHTTMVEDDMKTLLDMWRDHAGHSAPFGWFTDVWINQPTRNEQWGLGASISDTATQKWTAWNAYMTGAAPDAPTTLLVEAVGHHEVRLTWDLPAPTDSMVTVIERGPSSSGPWEVVANVPQPVTQMVDQLPVEEATWWYRAGTEDDVGRSAYTDPVEYQLDLPDQENRGRPNRLHRRRPVWIKDIDELLDVYLGWPSPKAPLSTVQVGGT